jgi:hypothetical protein
VSQPFNPQWSSTGYVSKKYGGQRNVSGADFSTNNQSTFNNERIFRYSELKLLYAEALIEKGRTAEAATQINDIRDRAGLPDLAGGANLTDAMRQEKRIELAFEPHRWFDIVRWGLGPTLFPTSWQDKYVVYPIPQTEIDRTRGSANEIKQNTGY